MRTAWLAGLVLALSTSCANAGYPITTPCNGNTNGLALIVQRPPTADELSAFVSATQFGQPTTKLVLMSDHITCDGANWNLTGSEPVTQPIRP